MTQLSQTYVNSLCSAVERKQCINMEGHGGPHNWVVDTTVEVLTADVRWLMQELLDDRTKMTDRCPDHICEFDTKPDKGACAFHERWFDCAAHVGLLDEWAEEDLYDPA